MRNDAFLWYNVPGWAEMGLAVPNYGNDTGTQNSTILQLTSLIGRASQDIMFHTDTRLRTPPSINTIIRIHKLCNRVRSIISSRAIAPGTPNMEATHAVPANEQFIVFPVPYFKVRNPWLKEYCGYALTALTEAFQHTENAKPIEVSLAFAGTISQYFQRINKLIAEEILQQNREKQAAVDYVIDDKVFATYDPSKWFTSTEMIDTVPMEQDIPTEDDLEPITNGIPVNQLPKLGRYLDYPVINTTQNQGGGSVSTTTGPVGNFIAPPSP